MYKRLTVGTHVVYTKRSYGVGTVRQVKRGAYLIEWPNHTGWYVYNDLAVVETEEGRAAN